MSVVIIGGSGYLGRHVASALQSAGLPFAIASRSSAWHVDLTRPETFAQLAQFQVVINASDSVRAPIEPLLQYCLEHGKTLLEMGVDPEPYRRILSRQQGATSGAVVLGVGIFPGLSNLLAAQAARAQADCQKLELGIRWNPFSGGGAGLVNLASHLVQVDTQRIVAGRAVSGPPMSAGPVLPFPSGERATLELAFPEPTMLHLSTRVPNISVYGMPFPRLLRSLMLSTPLWLLKSALMRMMMWLQFTLIRRLLRARRATPVELVCRAQHDNRGATVLALRTEDGLACAGLATAAMVSLLRERPAPSGVHPVESCFELGSVVQRMREIAPPQTRGALAELM